jgi:hypothetical protein
MPLPVHCAGAALLVYAECMNIEPWQEENNTTRSQNMKKKKGDCFAVQPLAYAKTQHDYEQKGRKKNKAPLQSKVL